MPRFYLALWFICFTFISQSQVKLKDLISFGDSQFNKGDYYYATQIYNQALQLDSNSVLLFYKMAETQKAYKNYVEAAKWYAKVYAEDQGDLYPNALVYYALMVKQTGNYPHALELFKKAYKEASQYPNEFAYIKSSQEIKSTQFAIVGLEDTLMQIKPMPDSINSYDAEFGHMFRDGIFYFSSLKADSISSAEEVYSKFYHTRIYKSLQDSSGFKKPKQWSELAKPEMSTGNGSFDLDGWYYYSICNDKGYNYQCKIVRYKQIDSLKYQLDTLQNGINLNLSNSTNPFITKLKNGKEVLFFSSDRDGGKGGMDLWYSIKNKGGDFSAPKNMVSINSIENEITPWYDTDSNQLYFSSNWHFGFGGYDVFKSNMIETFQFSKPKNVGVPINGPANDLYYFRQNDSLFVSSNRLGSKSIKNPTCCSDIFFAAVPKIPIPIPPPPIDSIPPETSGLQFPVVVYFRNDYPNPKSWAKQSDLSYDTLYHNYKSVYTEYLDSVQNKSTLQEFFNQKVDAGYVELLKLYDSVYHEFIEGKSVTLYLRGFASPLNYTKYNVNLTERRISSIEKFFLEYNNKQIQKYIQENPHLSFTIIEIPLGEYFANQMISDNLYNKPESVYSIDASLERRVEILSYTSSALNGINRISVDPIVQNEVIDSIQKINKKVILNSISTPLEIERIIGSDNNEITFSALKINEQKIEISFGILPDFKGKHTYEFIDIYIIGVNDPIRAYFTFMKN